MHSKKKNEAQVRCDQRRET